MVKTNIDFIYEALLDGFSLHRDDFDFRLSDVIRDLRKEGFKINHDPVWGYSMETESVSLRELEELRFLARRGKLAEQVPA